MVFRVSESAATTAKLQAYIDRKGKHVAKRYTTGMHWWSLNKAYYGPLCGVSNFFCDLIVILLYDFIMILL